MPSVVSQIPHGTRGLPHIQYAERVTETEAARGARKGWAELKRRSSRWRRAYRGVREESAFRYWAGLEVKSGTSGKSTRGISTLCANR
jgi:hypothetical protein